MKFTFTIDTDKLNDPAYPEGAIEDLKVLFKFLCGANPNYYEIGGMLSDQLNEQLLRSDRELVHDYLDSPNSPEASSYLKKLCGIETEYVLCSVTYHKYAKPIKDASYEMTDDFYEWLDDRIQCEDCKNGTQIYKDKDGYYLCISGSGLDEVHIRIKPFTWED